jgi:hypothetical protein
MKTKGPAVDGSVKGNMQYAEIRSTLASMTGKDRISAITKSLEENDDSLVAAALDASRFLTNLTVTEQAHMRELWAQKRMPVEMYGVVQLFRWSQSSRSRLLSDGLFKIALGAALAATNVMIIEGSLFSDSRHGTSCHGD